VLDDAASLAAVGLERLRDREALKQSEARHRLLTEHASDVIWTMDLNGRMSFVSPSIKKLLGYTPEEALQLHVSELLCPDSARKVLDQMQRARALVAIGQLYPEFDAELEQPHKNGGTVWAEVKTAGMYDELGGFIGIVGVARDLTERRRAEQQMRYLAQHDSLTGLPNRALFHDRLQQALNYCSRHQRQLAILLLDLNKFKPVNDTYGHAAGDELLKAVAGALRQSLRASDTVARLGGDEFVVLLPQLEQPNEAAKVAEKITAALAQPFKLSMAEVQIGCSIGSALFPDDGSDADALIIVADGRMYQQKQLRHEGR
jgi:diguanylate cyclase (GGDEF)-like protein/PAS domain S-box-containing protein